MNDQNQARTRAGGWNMASGALLMLGAGTGVTGAAIDQAGLIVTGLIMLALPIVAKRAADRDLTRLLDAVARRARTAALLEASRRIPHQAPAGSLTGGCPNPGWGPPTRARDAPAPAAPRPVGK
ncbi:MAG: hypothetical protein L0H96_25970 [Humibacillus sp.]|nr:hypothetical protein [Humibacillus sp.]